MNSSRSSSLCQQSLSTAPLWLLLIILVLAAPQVPAQSVRIPYDDKGTVELGSTLNILNYTQALDDCIAYDDSDIKFDTTGATKTRIKISLGSSYDEIMNDVSKDFSLSNKGTIGIPGITGEVDLNLSVKKTDYDKSVDRSLLIGLTARSEYGREYLRHYALKDSYKQQVVSKAWPSLASSCGTHFVRADSRVSQLTIVIAITGLDRSSKSTLTGAFKDTSKGSFKISDLSGSAETTISANIASVVELGKKLGTVSVDYIAIGGSGISAAGDTLKTMDPENIKPILDGLATASASFTQANSAPEKMLLIPMTIFGIPATPIDYPRLQKVAKLRQHAADVDSEIDLLNDYKSQNEPVFTKYFADSLTKLQALSASLNNSIQTCSTGGICSDDTATPTIAFIQDVFSDPALQMNCTFANNLNRYDYKGNRVKITLLDTATVNLNGKIHFADQLDLPSVKVFRINLDTGKVEDRTSAALNGFSISDPDASNVSRAFASIDYDNFASITANASARPFGELSEALLAARRSLSGSMYLLEFPTHIWIPKISVAVGIPDATKCPVSQAAN